MKKTIHIVWSLKGGKQFWVPNANSAQVTSYIKWEQAFRVFSDIYLKVSPSRATELVQYNHLIHSASMEFTWSNVYKYDKDFRLHLASFPKRSWAIILHQAWTLRMKDRVRGDFNQSYQNNQSEGPSGRDRHCRRFQKGTCSYGPNCKFEHKCKYCNKWGHRSSRCRKMKADKGGNVGSGQPI